jgi:ABC-type glycerol-3-phosphate transport system substrate-binding protein
LVLVTGVICLPPRLWSFLGGGEELVMVVWGQPFEDRLFQDVYATRFAELHPDVRISYQRYSDVMMKYEAWHAVGRGAEVMRIPITDYFSSVEKGMLADLTTFIDDPDIGLTAEQRADFFPWIWETLDLDGRFYALPSDNAQYGLFYNKTLFDEYNADHPDAPLSYPSVAWTWDDLQQAAEVLTTRDAAGNVTQYGILFDLWAWPFLTFYKQAGGEVWNAAQTTTFVDSSAGVAAMELIAELLPADAPIRTLDQPDTPSGPDDQFKIGKAAMLLDGSWRVPSVEIEAPELDFAVAPLPQGAAPGVVSGSVLWAVSAHAEDKRLAWQMVKWLIEREQALQYWDKLRVAPPARLSLVRSAGFRETRGIVDRETGRVIVPPMPRERYPARAAWLEYAITPHPQTGEMPGFLVLGPYQMDLELALSREMAEVVRGDQSAAEALAEVVRTVHATIDRDRAAKGLPPIDRAANSD